MSNVDKIAKDLAGIIKNSDSKATAPYDTKATVKKVENGIAWVQIPGGVDETPVQMTLSAKAGDTVQVRVSGGRAWITGNGTAPPTDDARANKAYKVAGNAIVDAQRAKNAADSAEESAGQAYNEAQNAKKTATNYIAELSNGIFVHPDGTPGDPHSSEACGVLITDKMEIRKDGATTAIYGDVTRIGNISNETVVYLLENYIEIGEDYFFVSNNGNTIGDFRAGANGVYEKRYSSENEARVKPSGSSEDYSNYEVGRFSIADITFNDGKTLELSLSINGTDLDLSFSDKTNRTIGDVKIVFEQDACIIKYNWQTSTLSYQYSYSYYVYYSRPRLDWHGEIKAFSNLIEHNGTRDISLQISEETIQKYVDLGMSIT